jgi:predicted DNA-binding transcriptional regulator YafY
MTVNKNALLRYKILDRCLSSGRTDYTFDKLLSTVNDALAELGYDGVRTRQLRKDLSCMRDSSMYNAPIVHRQYCGKKEYYTYDGEFSIFNNKLTDEEFVALRSTIKMLGRYRGGNAWIDDVIANLECRFDVIPNNDKLVCFEENAELVGICFLGDLIECAVNHEAIELVYRKFGGEANRYVFSIHCVKQFNGRWYICGQSKMIKESGLADNYRHSVLPIDRICRFKKSNRQFLENTAIDYSEFFKDVIGVTVPDDVPLQTFRLRFAPGSFPYVVSKPLHHSQRVVDAGNGIVEITVKRNIELDQKVFSYMPDVEVLAPADYRKHIADAIRLNLELYDK